MNHIKPVPDRPLIFSDLLKVGPFQIRYFPDRKKRDKKYTFYNQILIFYIPHLDGMASE